MPNPRHLAISLVRPSILIQKSLLITLLFVLFYAFLVTAPAAAQIVTGSVSGTVMDPSGAIVPGAAVTLINQRTSDLRRTTTNPEGRFVFSAVQPDTYTLQVEMQGFQRWEQQNIVLSAQESLALGGLHLKPGVVTEVVEVTGHGARIDTEASDLTGRLTADQISQISTKGRDITSLLRLMPGTSYIDDVESVGEGFGTDLPNFSGQRGRSSVVTIDGLNASEPSGSNKLSMTINQDAISEVKVLRNNYMAEYGNNGGAMLNIISKNGGQSYHGSAYYFLRNEDLNGNSWFNNFAGLARPLYRHNIWGVDLGGPVRIPWLFPNRSKKKLFFFYSFEKPHTITPQDARFVTVPTDLERNGDFSQSVNSSGQKVFIADPTLTGTCNATTQTSCFRDPSRATPSNPNGLNIIPIGRFDPNGRAILNFFPLPNTAGPFNYVVQKSVDVPKWSQLIRFDIQPTESDTINVKGQWWTSDNEGFQTSGWPGGTPPDANTWGISSHYLYKDNGLSVGWVHIFNPNLINEVTVGVRHDSEGFIPSDGVIPSLSRETLHYTAPQLFPANNELGTIPRVTGWTSVAGRPANINWLDRWGETGNDYILPSVAGNLTINRGEHIFKVGYYLEHMRNGEAPGGNWSGTFNFGTSSAFTAALGSTGYAYANALIGNFNSYTESSSRPHTNLEMNLFQWYVQDSWKIARSFTLNYGLRVGYHSQWYQRDKLASNFDPLRYSIANAVALYEPFCTSGTPPPGTKCATANQRARNPVTGALSTNTSLIGTLVPGVGDPNNGVGILGDGLTPAGFKQVQPIDLEPRLGFAWDVFGRGKTVLRAMGGVYHAPRTGGGTTGGNLVNNQPFQSTVTLNFGNIGQLTNPAFVASAKQTPSAINAVEVLSNTPTTYNFSLGLQQDIGFKTVVEATYVGSLSRHLGERRNINGVPDGARFLDLHPENQDPVTGTVKTDNLLRRFRGFADITTVMYTGTSNYNGLQVQLNRWYAKNLQYGIAYTWSKSMDYANDDSSDVFFSRPYRQFNYGPSDFDQTQIFTANYIWTLPSIRKIWDSGFSRAVFDNWQISGITSLVSGRPKSIGTITYSCPSGVTCNLPNTVVTDFTGGEVNARPNLVCDPNSVPAGATAPSGLPLLINTSCFAKPTVRGDIGNTPRNVMRLPGIITTDMALSKFIHVTEKSTLQFRWEAYNLFNHTNFKDIDTNMTFDASGNQTNKSFGAPTSARPSRVMQGSLRFSF